MQIITHVTTEVKDYEEKNPKVRRSQERYADKWLQKKRFAKLMAEKLRAIGDHRRAVRMENCAEVVSARICADCGQVMLDYANLCRDRFCPICKWRLSMKRFAQMLQIVTGLRVAYPEAEWQFVTLTAKNCPASELTSMLDEMGRCWNSITSSKKFQDKVAGWAKSVEITYNSRTGELHPHFHIILMYHEGQKVSEYVVQRWLAGIRLKATGLAQCAEKIVWAVSADQDICARDTETEIDREAIWAILETFKYATKDSEILELPTHTFFYVARLLGNRRLISYGGIIKEYAKECEIDEDSVPDEEDEESALDMCCRCKSKALIEVVARWSGQAYIWRRAE